MNNLKIYVPKVYEDVEEIDTLIEVEQELFSSAEDQVNLVKSNQYILTNTEEGIAQHEKQLGIIPNVMTEDLNLRRQRIINRISTRPPFTLEYLKQRLDVLVGVGKYTVTMDYENYTLYVESSASNQFWGNEISVTMNLIKPANIVYINIPYVSEDVDISEEVSYNQIEYNYRLGTSWVLGAGPFASTNYKGVIKMAEANSIKSDFLNGLSAQALNMISGILINNTEKITTFKTKTTEDNIVTLEYYLTTGLGISEVTNIKLVDGEDNVLTEAVVYVPLLSDAVVKHTIKIKEGA